ncbi:MAG: hypothetical protein JW749_01695 [Sedimentisphaerales bacterium]|nr:hypothetical protein [Sedimentisphaerales bacterium]
MAAERFSNLFKALIFVSALLVVPFTQSSWAKTARNKGNRNRASTKLEKTERSQARERQNRPISESSAFQLRKSSSEITTQPKVERRRFFKRETAGFTTGQTSSERPAIERSRSNPDNPSPRLQPAPQVSEPRETRSNTEAARTKKRDRSGRFEIASQIRVPMGTQTQNTESNRQRENRQNTGRTGREGRDMNPSGVQDRPSRREVVENISEHRPNRRTRRPDTDNSSIFNRDRSNGDNQRHGFTRSRRSTELIGPDNHTEYIRLRHLSTRRVIYEDLNKVRRRNFNFSHVFRDRHHRVIHRIIWPSFYYPICYDWGSNISVSFVYPYYHRRYIFVSLGGYWPDYSCVRYYWYPAHSYFWYGYYPLAQEVGGDTYNYYTYNYYGQQTETTGVDNEAGATGLTPVDHTTFADVREKLAQQKAQEPTAQTNADTLFDEGVKAFEQGNYAEAELKFAQAIGLEPQDIILPFAYAQTMLAQGKYNQAADVLRLALQKSSPDKQGVYFPRGLYTDENLLMDQIDTLTTAAQSQPADTNLQLLLGYQFLGIGEAEKAIVPLQNAKADPPNSAAAAMLLDLAEKIKAGETQ